MKAFSQTISTAECRLARLRMLVHLLDEAIEIPGIGFKIGLDPILGLVPWLGDVTGAVLSTWMLFEAASLGAPRRILAAMAGNTLIDLVAGAVPVIGDLADFGWKANTRNLKLLDDWIAGQH